MPLACGTSLGVVWRLAAAEDGTRFLDLGTKAGSLAEVGRETGMYRGTYPPRNDPKTTCRIS